MLDLRPRTTDHSDARLLDGEVQRYYAQIYGDEDLTPVGADQFRPPLGLYRDDPRSLCFAKTPA